MFQYFSSDFPSIIYGAPCYQVKILDLVSLHIMPVFDLKNVVNKGQIWVFILVIWNITSSIGQFMHL